jgi:hypothetical protein
LSRELTPICAKGFVIRIYLILLNDKIIFDVMGLKFRPVLLTKKKCVYFGQEASRAVLHFISFDDRRLAAVRQASKDPN